MKVRVKDDMKGFIYGNLKASGDEITLIPVTCVKRKDSKGNPLVLSPEDQFSDVWMDKVKGKPGRKAKDIEDESSQL